MFKEYGKEKVRTHELEKDYFSKDKVIISESHCRFAFNMQKYVYSFLSKDGLSIEVHFDNGTTKVIHFNNKETAFQEFEKVFKID